VIPSRAAAAWCCAIAAYVTCVIASVGIAARRQPPPAEKRAKPLKSVERIVTSDTPDDDCRFSVTQGRPETAATYYALIASPAHLDMKNLLMSTLSDVPAYLGWSGARKLTAKDLELKSAAFFDAIPDDDAISTSYFAPKVSLAGVDGRQKIFGWRKLIRLRALQGSEADRRGIEAAYILFNATARRPRPVLLIQDYIQVMLVSRSTDDGKYAAYWLVYRGHAHGYDLTNHIRATFEGGDFSTVAGAGQNFYVPESCAQCHGQDEAAGLLNMLDTDHWLDRVQQGDDFTAIGGVGAVLQDAGNHVGSERFRRAFARIRTLNEEIEAQNRRAGTLPFRQQALTQWLTIHAASDAHRPLEERAFSTDSTAAAIWTKADRPLLNDLNRYCYRCHSTIAFSVFDKPTIVRKKRQMAAMVESGCMPRDQHLDKATADNLAARLRNLQ
jgi:hypothetical protein